MLEMTLPSSPPLLPQSSFNEPPSSPPLPPTRSSSSKLPVLGKRQLSEFDSNISSDPLFSDDTSGNEDVMSYQRPKRKRMIKGRWWEVAERRKADNDATPKQKLYTRNVDSGVWMGSDGSEEHVEHDLGSLGTSSVMGVQNRPRAIQLVPATTQRQTPRTLAEDIVTRCVEDGKDRVDLSQLGLTELVPSTLKPLHELIRQPTFDVSMPPSDDELGPLIPDLQLFLAANNLTSLPYELFNLQNLTVLSVRNNALTELSSAISRLKRLQELNIGNNALHWLPWELLDILQSRHVRAILHPNPFMEPSPDDLESEATLQSMQRSSVHAQLQQSANLPPPAETITEPRSSERGALDLQTQLSLRLQLGHALREQSARSIELESQRSNAYEELIFLSSSTIRYYDIDGHLSVARSSPLNSTTQVPSLLEVSLRGVRQNYSLAQIPETLPDRVQSILKVASEAPEDQVCSTCANGYILPRAEWIEYWYRGLDAKVELTPESVLPFRRRVCSWKCAIPTGVGSFRA